MSDRGALLDTSVLIARETGRPVDLAALPERAAAGVVTIGELQAGVLAAADLSVRAQRLASLEAATVIEALPITVEAARRRAELRVRLAQDGRRAKVNDL